MRHTPARTEQALSAALLATATLFSTALACGMPFAAVGAMGALFLPPRSAIGVAVAAWLVNQAIGFGLLGYPADLMTLAWGAAIGLSAIAAPLAARAALHVAEGPAGLRWIAAFASAWVAQPLVIVLAGVPLGGYHVSLAPAVLWFMLWTNALAFAVMLAATGAARRLGLSRAV